MNEQIDIRALVSYEPDCNVICAWIHFPNQILIYAQENAQKLRRISCKDSLASTIKLLETTTEQYGKDYQSMLIWDKVGGSTKTQLFKKDTSKSEGDVMLKILDYIRLTITE